MPIEALPTDINELKDNFKNIKDPIHKDSSNDISNSLKELLFKEGIKENNDPLHLYFIGLAYLNGIDTERNVDRAVKILDKSLDKGLIEAGFALFRICYNQLFNYPKAIEYADRAIKMMNESYLDYVAFLREYFGMLRNRAYYDKALEINKILYDVSSEDNKLERKNIEAKLYFKKGDNKKCVDILYELYKHCKDKYGINDDRTQRNGYSIFWFCNDDAIIKELENDGLDFYAHVFGNETEEEKPEEKPDDMLPSLDVLLNRFAELSNVGKVTEELIDVGWKIANQYYEKEQYSDYLKFKDQNYEYCEELYGVLDRKTEHRLKGVLASYQEYYRKTKDESHFDRVISICEQNYNKKMELLGEKNPKTMASLDVFIRNCKLCKKTDKAIDLMKKRLNLLIKIYGSTHPNVTALQDELKTMTLEEK